MKRGQRTKKVHHKNHGNSRAFSPERFSPAARGVLHTRNLARFAHYSHRDRWHRRWISNLEKQSQMVRGLGC